MFAVEVAGEPPSNVHATWSVLELELVYETVSPCAIRIACVQSVIPPVEVAGSEVIFAIGAASCPSSTTVMVMFVAAPIPFK